MRERVVSRLKAIPHVYLLCENETMCTLLFIIIVMCGRVYSNFQHKAMTIVTEGYGLCFFALFPFKHISNISIYK